MAPRLFSIGLRTEEVERHGIFQRIKPKRGREAATRRAAATIDTFMKKVGYANPADRTDEDGWRYFALGSAEGRAGIIESDGEPFLCVEAPVMPLPSDKELILPLMRELLEINLHIAGEQRIGITDEHIYVRLLSPVQGMTDDDFGRCIHAVMATADNLDDQLMEKYGGTTKQRSQMGNA